MPTTLSVITDEIAPALSDVLAFAASEGLTALEVRQIDGANFLALEPAVLRAAAARIADAGLIVTALTTPLLKWPAPGQPFAMTGDQFGFDRHVRDSFGLPHDYLMEGLRRIDQICAEIRG